MIKPEATNTLYESQMEDNDDEEISMTPEADATTKPVPESLILFSAAIGSSNVKGINYTLQGNELIKQGQIVLCIFASDLISTIDDKE